MKDTNSVTLIEKIGKTYKRLLKTQIKDSKYFTIGRGKEASISIDNIALDEIHGVFSLKEDCIEYEDLNSRHGSIVVVPTIERGNGSKLDIYSLHNNRIYHYIMDGSFSDLKDVANENKVLLKNKSFIYMPCKVNHRPLGWGVELTYGVWDFKFYPLLNKPPSWYPTINKLEILF